MIEDKGKDNHIRKKNGWEVVLCGLEHVAGKKALKSLEAHETGWLEYYMEYYPVDIRKGKIQQRDR